MIAFYLIAFMGAILLFFFCSFMYKPLGELIERVIGKAINIIKDEDEKNNESEEK